MEVDTMPMDMRDENAGDSQDQYLEQDATSTTFYAEGFPGAAFIFDKGETFVDQFDRDDYASKRKDNMHYPFASLAEWELASFLLLSSLSMAAIDNFLKLQLVSPDFSFPPNS